jgi:hypothetical protein
MEHYVGLDVSWKLTSICVVNQTGSIVQKGVVSSDPEGDRFIREIEGTRNGTDRHRDRTDDYVAMERAQATWPAGNLHRCVAMLRQCAQC